MNEVFFQSLKTIYVNINTPPAKKTKKQTNKKQQNQQTNTPPQKKTKNKNKQTNPQQAVFTIFVFTNAYYVRFQK